MKARSHRKFFAAPSGDEKVFGNTCYIRSPEEASLLITATKV